MTSSSPSTKAGVSLKLRSMNGRESEDFRGGRGEGGKGGKGKGGLRVYRRGEGRGG